MVLIFLLLPPLLSSLDPIGDELARPRRKTEALVFDLVSYVEALLLGCFGVAPAFWSLAVNREVLACRYGEAKVLIFDLAVVAKALAQFEHSSEVLVFNLDASPEAMVQFEQATKAVELMLERCLRLLLDKCLVAFAHDGATTLPSNMVDARPYQLVSSVVGGCYESSCDTLPQPLILTSSWHGAAAQQPLEVVHHLVVDVYNLSMVFAGQRELL